MLLLLKPCLVVMQVKSVTNVDLLVQGTVVTLVNDVAFTPEIVLVAIESLFLVSSYI